MLAEPTTDHCPSTTTCLEMHHRGLVLVDAHARLQQLLVVGVAREPDQERVRVRVRQQDAHVHAGARAARDGLARRLVGHEVGGADLEPAAARRGSVCMKKSRSGWFSLGRRAADAGVQRDVVARAGRASPAGSSRGPRGSRRSAAPTGPTNADWSVVASGPVTRTMLSRQWSSLSASPSHLSPTAMPPVKPTLPSITIARRWLRLWKRVSLPRRGARKNSTLPPRHAGRRSSREARGPLRSRRAGSAPGTPARARSSSAATTSSFTRPFLQM